MSDQFAARQAHDACKYRMSYRIEESKITSVTVDAEDSSCGAEIPITFPVKPTSTNDFRTEQRGKDPLTVWVKLSGLPVTFDLSSPIPV